MLQNTKASALCTTYRYVAIVVQLTVKTDQFYFSRVRQGAMDDDDDDGLHWWEEVYMYCAVLQITLKLCCQTCILPTQTLRYLSLCDGSPSRQQIQN